MMPHLSAAVAAVSALLLAMSGSGTAFAQKRGGILRMYTPDSPASLSILEEATPIAQVPMMGVFNNLVMFDQHVTAEQPAIDRARSGDRLVVERGWDRADLAAAPRASNGTTASRSPPRTSNAPGTC